MDLKGRSTKGIRHALQLDTKSTAIPCRCWPARCRARPNGSRLTILEVMAEASKHPTR